MTQDEVIKLMESSKSEEEWNTNCDTVKNAFGGNYPDYWFVVIILGGSLSRAISKYGW